MLYDRQGIARAEPARAAGAAFAREKENQQLRQELDDARAELNKRQIDVAKAGTMAEAALLLNGIFDAADRAALQYLENIRLRAEGTNK